MKYLIPICALLTTIFVWSCNKHAGGNRKTVVEVKIINFVPQPGNNRFILEVGDFGGDATTFVTTVHKDTVLKFRFDQYIAQDIKITPYIENFMCHPGDSISINLDYKQTNEVKFSGDAAETNIQLYHYTTENYSYFDNGNMKLYLSGLDSSNYKSACENMREELLKKREEFINRYNANDEVKTWTKNDITIRYYKALGEFAIRYYFRTASQNPNMPIVTLNGFAPNKVILNEIYNTGLLNASSYDLLKYIRLPHPMYVKKGDSIIQVKIDPKVKADQEKLGMLIHHFQTGELFYFFLLSKNLPEFEKRKSLFDSISEPFIKQPLSKYYNLVKKNLIYPKKKSDEMVKYANSTNAGNLIKGIQAKYKGKVVLVDFWTTWCGPCISEMPAEKMLEERLKGKNVVFVHICLDSPVDVWKKDVQKFQLSGPQLYFDSRQSGKIRQGLGIQAIPHHILFNQNGDIEESSLYLGPNRLTERKINELLNHPRPNISSTNRDSIKSLKVITVK